MIRRLRRRFDLRSSAGFTLTELLTVLSILSIILGGLTVLFVSATKAQVDVQTRFRAQQEARLAMDALRREVHCASAITQTGPSPTVTLSLPVGCTTGSGPVTWCTVSAGTSRYELYRKPGSTCDSAGKRYADYITIANVFSYYASTTTTRAKLGVQLPVDSNLNDGVARYSLVDALVLRNSIFQ